MKILSAMAGALLVLSGFVSASAKAEPVEYVRVCDAFGTGWFYIPGSETCLNASSHETRTMTEDGVVVGESELRSRFESAFAINLAIPTAYVEQNHNFAFAMNLSLIEGNSAIGASGAMRLNEHTTFNGGIGADPATGMVGGRAGFNVSW